ncbi:MAG: hypothetical protein P1P69_05675 [Methanosarcinaceae archaeon]|nr:hypothetical protein [Methanosarcinaceae archaeon]
MNDMPLGEQIKYVEIKTINLSYSEEKIVLIYSDYEISSIDETTLMVFSYYNSSWVKLLSELDVERNTITFSNNYDSSVFVLVSHVQEDAGLFKTFGVNSLEVDNNADVSPGMGAANNDLTLAGSVVDKKGNVIDIDIEVVSKVQEKTGSMLPFNYEKSSSMAVGSYQRIRSSNNFSIVNISESTRVIFNGLTSKNVSASFTIRGNASSARIVLDDYGVNNPVSTDISYTQMKFVEVHADNMDYSDVEVTIQYTDEELGGWDETKLQMYHWNGSEWEPLLTRIDTVNNLLVAITTSLSPLGVATLQESVVAGTPYSGLEDCVTCHDVGANATAPDVDVSSINSTSLAIHRNLNNNATNSSALTDMVVKACWACHGDGTENTNHHDVITNCTDCHLQLTDLNLTDSTRRSDLNNSMVSEHQQFGDDITASPAGNESCQWCHNKSMGSYTDPDAASNATDALAALVSHYAVIPTINTTDCSNCHKNTANATIWNVTEKQVRHPAKSNDGAFCDNCHNTSSALSFHSSDLRLNKYLHIIFDWENDDDNEGGLVPNDERCAACHKSLGSMQSIRSEVDICEECHLADGRGPFNTVTGFNLRSDINDTLPIVYMHINGSVVDVKNQSNAFLSTSKTKSSCYGFNKTTGEGSCHGVTFGYNTSSGGYFAFNDEYIGTYANRDPYLYNSVLDNLPNTTQCTFCHNQSDTDILTTWGNATQLTSGNHWWNLNFIDSECWACHTTNSAMPKDFHAAEVTLGGGLDCVSCHDVGRDQEKVDISGMNSTNAIHYNLNNQSAGLTLNSDNQRCWACHGDGNGAEGEQPNFGHPNNYRTPKDCLDCHNGTGNFSASSVKEHTDYGSVISTVENCTDCHSKSLGSYTDDEGSLAANVSHYATHPAIISTECGICHENTANAAIWNVTNKQVRHPAMLDDAAYCINCHNSTGTSFHSMGLVIPNNIHEGFDWEGDDNSEIGTSGESESCSVCHNSDRTIIRNCENCHLSDNSSDFTGPRNDSSIILRSDVNSTIPRVYEHTNFSEVTVSNLSSLGGTKSSCFGFSQITGDGTCHGVQYEKRTESGGYYANNMSNSGSTKRSNPFMETNTLDHLPNSTQCTFCHNQSDTTIWNVWGNATLLTSDNHNWYLNFIDSDCWNCHTTNGTQPVDFHSSEISPGGGPDCVSCHDVGNAVERVNVSVMNDSLAFHADINSFSSGRTLSAENERCWACHGDGNGTEAEQSGGGHPSNYRTPKLCDDCHINFTLPTNYSAMQVFEHYVYGENLTAIPGALSASESCITCHSKAEMTLNYSTDPGGVKSIYAAASHYGKYMYDLVLGGVTDCKYCHVYNSSAFYDVFVNKNLTNMSDHTTISTGPSCTNETCHNSGRKHDRNLTKPTFVDALCQTCHTDKKNHNVGVNSSTQANCTTCHTEYNVDIHGIKFIQNDPSGVYSTSNSSATVANCTTCHQNSITGFETAPQIPASFSHSANPNAGQIWGSYWNSSSDYTACEYCHNDTKHLESAIGNISSISGGDTKDGAYSSSGRWCAGCHIDSDSDYGLMVINYTAVGVPPEITGNATYGANESNLFFFNHTGINESDETCASCHGGLLSGNTTTELVHSIDEGYGGCTNCHYDYTFMSTRTADAYVNSTMFNESVHVSLDCINCHTKGHYNIGARKSCEDCHVVQSDPVNDTNRHNITSTPSLYQVGGVSVVTITDCTICHESGIYASSTSNFNKDAAVDCDYCHTYPDKNKESFY